MWKLFQKPEEVTGSQPAGFDTVQYWALPRRTQQDAVNYVWPHPVTQYGARVTNTWWGNQMPGYTNFIPGVHNPLFMQQRNLQLQNNVVLSRGNNGTVIQVTPAQGDMIQSTQGLSYDIGVGGIWQRREY